LGPGKLQHYGLRQDRQLWPQTGTQATTQAKTGSGPRAIPVPQGRTLGGARAQQIALLRARRLPGIPSSPMRPTCGGAPGPGCSGPTAWATWAPAWAPP